MILGNLFSLQIYQKQPWYSAIGASGAVSGIIFASIAMAPNEISVNFLPGWLFGTLYFGYSVYMMLNPKQWDNLGHAAHLGGAFFRIGILYCSAPTTGNEQYFIPWGDVTAINLSGISDFCQEANKIKDYF